MFDNTLELEKTNTFNKSVGDVGSDRECWRVLCALLTPAVLPLYKTLP
jgi:hypothetical protein